MVLVTTTGLYGQACYTCGAATSTYSNGWKWMGIGISSSSEAMTNTGLISEITSGGGGIRSTCTLATSNYTSIWSNTYSFTTNFSVNECGIFDTSSGTGGHCFMRHGFSATKAVANGDTLTITLKLTQAT